MSEIEQLKEIVGHLRTASADVDRLIAERDALREDARRYRWLRDVAYCSLLHTPYVVTGPRGDPISGESLDQAIDAVGPK